MRLRQEDPAQGLAELQSEFKANLDNLKDPVTK